MGVLSVIPGGKCFEPPIHRSTRCSKTHDEFFDMIWEDLLPHQKEFVADTEHKILGLCAGFGAGKTYSLCVRILIDCMRYPNTVLCVFEPTYQMLLDVFIRSFEEILEKYGVEYDYRASPQPEFIVHTPTGKATLLCRTMESYNRIRGANLSMVYADEIDTSRPHIAEKASQMILARLRGGPNPQFCLASTPEGYGYMWQTFTQTPGADRRLIKAKTLDNPYLPDGFVDSLYANYPPQLLAAYLNGEFVALDKTVVYPYFDRDTHWSDETILPTDTIYVGADFNVGASFLEVFIRRGEAYHVIEEHHPKDTPSVVKLLKERFPEHIAKGQLTIIPDASSRKRTTSNAAESDLGILRKGGLRVKIQNSNPLIEDRVNAVNVLLMNNRIFINPSCKYLIRSFETQTYNDSGQPDKSGRGVEDRSGPVDAAGYVVHALAGLRRYVTGGSNFRFK
jgi:hypothetical protein